MAAFGFKVEGRVGCVLPPPAVQKPLSPPGSPPSMSPEGLAAIQELMQRPSSEARAGKPHHSEWDVYFDSSN